MVYYQAKANLLNQKTIIITGAGDGIGREVAFTYSRYGANLILIGKTTAKLEQVKQEIISKINFRASVSIYTMDFLSLTESKCHELATDISQRYPYLDGVLHNASILTKIAPIIEQPIKLWHKVIQINVNATFMLTQALLPLLLQAPNSSLIFTTSSVGRRGRANWGAYSVSKFATEGLMQVLFDEYKNTNLRVNCINPGGTRTKMRAYAFPLEDPMKLKTPQEIMSVYLYLMGEDSIKESGLSFDAQPA
ncbi:putative oxidoreductase YciK [Arsenophonus endosymbiont of Aleurodicus dispersus]|uniref:YciK family oxidoreductase n=1 Tax=Arsenophonus endosymbiont of Aleurodicus dispersus TaxID=235559 RepID=UPI000EB1DC7D|nr:YciK family oxidoreductase [Arsenophonus endosymbiont of Aleurodicus dispersus]VAY02436.1 putative oxidoreductase YciK [Arsenophonus endosymbiont of Aleurodicus dispersus]